MKIIYLIGFMGSGKTTVGRALSKSLSLPLVDTDDYIVHKYNKTINEIFRLKGEQTFRTYETEVLKEINDKCIVSTGGGIIQKTENRELMKEKGIVLYLNTPFYDIVQRLKSDSDRPLWHKDKVEEMQKLYDQRQDLYKTSANFIVRTNGKTIGEIVNELKNYLM